MKVDLIVPQVGESITEGLLATWLKQDGEYIDQDEEIFELETEKITLSVPSPAAGVLKIKVAEGTVIEIGSVVGSIDTEQATAGKTKTVEHAPEQEQSRRVVRTQDLKDALSPAVNRLITEHKLDPADIKGSGKRGQITKGDVLAVIDSTKNQIAPPPIAPTHVHNSEGERRISMSPLRQKIAQNLVSSKSESAHLTTFNEVDMSQVIEIRKSYQEEFVAKNGVKLGFMSFFIKSVQKALEEYPGLNAFVDGKELVYHDYYHIGVALSSEKGLITPVVRDVNQKSFARIEQDIVGFKQKVTNKKLLPQDLMGATFTVTNGGIFGSMLSTPIPSPPQSGILGMHTIQKRAVVVEDEIVIRPMMYIALTYDHRIVDGREAVGFLVAVKQWIEDPRHLLIEL